VNDGRDEEGRHAIRQGAAYQGALEAVFAILIAGGIGYWVDSRWGTSPWGLFLGFAVGFASFVLRLIRLGRQVGKDVPPAAAAPPAGDETDLDRWP
jgi:F0F1-type ATP synthase assembly protein I